MEAGGPGTAPWEADSKGLEVGDNDSKDWGAGGRLV